MSPKNIPPRPPIFSFVSADPETPQIRVERVEPRRTLNQHSSKAHVHNFPQIIYCEQDGGSHRLGTQQWDVKAGDLFLIAPYEIHDADNLGARWVLQFTVDAIWLQPDICLWQIAPIGYPFQTVATTTVTPPSENSLLSIYSNPLLLPFLRLAGTQSGYFHITRQKQPMWTQYLQSLQTELHLKQPGYKEAARAYVTSPDADLTVQRWLPNLTIESSWIDASNQRLSPLADRLPTGAFGSSESLSTTVSYPRINTISAAA